MNHHCIELGGPFLRGHLVPPFVGLTATDWHVLMILTSYDYSRAKGADHRKGYSYPGNTALCSVSGQSESTVKRALRKLEEEVYIFRTRLHRGRGKRDHRTIYINYSRLERGHRHVVALQARKNGKQIRELEETCLNGFMEDDLAFIKRLLIEGSVSLEELEKKAESFTTSRLARVIAELAILIDGSSAASTTARQDSIQTESSSTFPSSEIANEEDEVRDIRRSVLIRRSDLPSDVSPTPIDSLLQASTKPLDDSHNQLAGSIRGAIAAWGVTGRKLERAVAIALHCCIHSGIVNLSKGSEIASLIAMDTDWDSEFALSDYAYGMAHYTGCYS